MDMLPIMLQLEGKTVLVVGAGPVGLRRCCAAASAGARVRLVALGGASDMDTEDVDVVAKAYDPSHLEGVFVVFACTNDASLNARIAEDARGRDVLVNVADQPADCDFYMPATLREGCVTVAVGTGGRAPGLSGMLRDVIADALPERLAEFAEALGQLRGELRGACDSDAKRMTAMRPLCTPAGYELFCRRGLAGLREAAGRTMEGG
jgi:siroheme synthase-like protein